jgi:hypothetical protein
MTKPLEMTNRALLEKILEQLQGRERESATMKMLAANVDRLIREKEQLMGMIGRMMIERVARS